LGNNKITKENAKTLAITTLFSFSSQALTEATHKSVLRLAIARFRNAQKKSNSHFLELLFLETYF